MKAANNRDLITAIDTSRLYCQNEPSKREEIMISKLSNKDTKFRTFFITDKKVMRQ